MPNETFDWKEIDGLTLKIMVGVTYREDSEVSAKYVTVIGVDEDTDISYVLLMEEILDAKPD